MSETTATRYFDYEGAAQYLRDLGFSGASRETIKHHACVSKKLGRPKVVAKRNYWTQEQLDALVDAL